MTNNVTNVALAVDGGIYIGAVGATQPTGSGFSPTTNGYTHVGYYSSDGATLTPVAGTETEIFAHNGDSVYDEMEPGWWTFGYSAIELRNAAVAGVFFDAPINSGEGSVTVTTAAVTTYRSLINIAINKDGTSQLYHYPRVKISERQAITFNRTTLEAAGMTFKTFKDPTLGYHFKGFDPAWNGVPTISGATPSAAAQGAQVKIVGHGFAGVTGAASVKFGGTNASSYIVDDDETIFAIMPAGSAGAANVIVTNATGASAAFTYTRGA